MKKMKKITIYRLLCCISAILWGIFIINNLFPETYITLAAFWITWYLQFRESRKIKLNETKSNR